MTLPHRNQKQVKRATRLIKVCARAERAIVRALARVPRDARPMVVARAHQSASLVP